MSLVSLASACLGDLVGSSTVPRPSAVHLDAVMRWLCRAHDAGHGGVAKSYTLRRRKTQGGRGWLAAYPETTGYIIPTFFDYAARTGDREYRDRAVRMAEWEIGVQMASGAVQGGVVSLPPTPAVFNSGQVLFGWCRAFEETGDERFRRAARRAAEFMLDMQDTDGAWRRGGSRYVIPGAHAYDARSAWGLLDVHHITGDDRYREAAVSNLDFVLTRQTPNGWFADACLTDNRRPLLHTIAYTLSGLLEAGVRLGITRYVDAARAAVSALIDTQRADGSLAGRFDPDWRPVTRWSCLTGNAQTAILCLRLFELTEAPAYRQAAHRLVAHLKATQSLDAGDPGVRGGIKGAQPIWGPYASYEYPSWAAKFFADALMLEARCLAG